jgi:tartrate-resistant acid phosphatase type 5
MSRIAQRGSVVSANCDISGWWKWLAVSFLLIFIQACYPNLRTLNAPTQTGIRSTAGPSVVNPSISQAATQSQTTLFSITQTYTLEPATPEPNSKNTTVPSASTPQTVVFAAIGDYGSGSQSEADVAKLVLSWQPNFIITLGDNNYPSGAADHIDEAVGQFYHSYIYPYSGNYGAGAEVNQFFPSLGNHDLISEKGQAYFDYFSLPGNERYYDFTWGPVHLFALDDLDSEPDGVGVSSVQATWLKTGLAASSSAWNIVYMHYPPYSSGMHGSTDWARWPYAEWGADAVLAGHDHTYERLEENGLTYFVNGLGGMSKYDFMNILIGSQVRYNADYGAIRVEATETQILFEFINRKNEVVDSYEIKNK